MKRLIFLIILFSFSCFGTTYFKVQVPDNLGTLSCYGGWRNDPNQVSTSWSTYSKSISGTNIVTLGSMYFNSGTYIWAFTLSDGTESKEYSGSWSASSSEIYHVETVYWYPPETNVPLNPSNIVFNIDVSADNPYSFPADLYAEFLDENGNVVAVSAVGTILPNTIAQSFETPLFWPSQDAVNLRMRMKPNPSVPLSDSALDILMDSDGYIRDGLVGASWQVSGIYENGMTEYDYVPSLLANMRSTTVAAAGLGSASRSYTQMVNLAVSSVLPPNVASSVNIIARAPSSSNSTINDTAAGTAAGVSAALNLSGVIDSLSGVTDAVNNSGETVSSAVGASGSNIVSAVGGLGNSFSNSLSGVFGSGSLGPGIGESDDPMSGLGSASSGSDFSNALSGSDDKANSIMTGVGESIVGWCSISFPTVSDRKYSWPVTVGSYSFSINVSSYSDIIEMFRTLLGWFLTLCFITYVMSITRKGIA